MKVLIFLLFTLVPTCIYSRNVNRVHLIGHTAYMINFIQGLVSDLEERGWCNLKVPVLTSVINATIIDRDLVGTVTYSNGFMVSMQVIDMLQRNVDQIWSWNNTDSSATVRQTAILRMLDVTLGYDVVVELQDGRHRYTVTVTYPETHFDFSMRTNINTGHVEISVSSRIVTLAARRTVKFLPLDDVSDYLSVLFPLRLPEPGIQSWGEEVLVPIAYNVYNQLEFPRVCYDCPSTVS